MNSKEFIGEYHKLDYVEAQAYAIKKRRRNDSTPQIYKFKFKLRVAKVLTYCSYILFFYL
ncbi:MAG TPA: hypothetical protein DD722_03405 [Lachnospiraceae bacterium]|nr:hypothetical protein [Lachnospiraceae bacterium]